MSGNVLGASRHLMETARELQPGTLWGGQAWQEHLRCGRADRLLEEGGSGEPGVAPEMGCTSLPASSLAMRGWPAPRGRDRDRAHTRGEHCAAGQAVCGEGRLGMGPQTTSPGEHGRPERASGFPKPQLRHLAPPTSRLASRTIPPRAAARHGPARCAVTTGRSLWCWWSSAPSASSSSRSGCSTTAGSAACPSSSTCRTARSCASWRAAATTTPRWTWPATASRRCRRSRPASTAAPPSTARAAGARSWGASGTPRTRTCSRRTRTCERGRVGRTRKWTAAALRPQPGCRRGASPRLPDFTERSWHSSPHLPPPERVSDPAPGPLRQPLGAAPLPGPVSPGTAGGGPALPAPRDSIKPSRRPAGASPSACPTRSYFRGGGAAGRGGRGGRSSGRQAPLPSERGGPAASVYIRPELASPPLRASRAMDTSDLFASCRKGDVGRVRYLLEQRDVEVNVRDKWDSTPLYYACLCGHEELVLYLLANGARCEANTFDGERCLYGALSDAIRRALCDYKQVTASCRRRDYYDDFLQRLLEQGIHSDVVFVVHGKSFRVHRCVLGARSAYFANMLDTKWKGKSVVVLRHPLINPVAFGALLQYLYTGRLDIGVEHVSDCERLAKQCQLWDLLSDLEAKCEKVSEFVASKPGTCVKVLTIEPPPADQRLREDLALLADCALPPELRGDLGELPFPCPDGFNSCPDVCFRVADCSFLCHKAFFCGRSDYFRALLDDHFRESEEPVAPGSPAVVTLHGVSPDTFTHVLYYVYSDHTELPPEAAYDVLSVADMYLLPGLKRLCGRSLAQLLDEDSVVGVWRVAKLFRLARLEDQCTEYMAKVIEKLVEREDFVEAVREEAAAVAERQETDSIPLVDDIRFHVASTVQTYSAIEEAQQRLRVLEELLVAIGLDC